MNWLFPASIATGCGLLFLCLASFYLYTQYRERFLALWALGWFVSFLRYACMVAGLWLGAGLLTSVGYYFFTLLGAVLLIHGTMAFLGKPEGRWPATSGALVFGWSLVAIWRQWPEPLLHIPVFFFLAFAFISLGRHILREGSRGERAKRLVGWLFIGWGVHQANYPLLRPIEWFAPWGYIVGALFALSIAICLIIMHFERMQKILQGIALSTLRLYDTELFAEIVNRLTGLFNCRYALISRIDAEGQRMHTLAVCVDGEAASNFSYPLTDSPCAEVTAQAFCLVPKNLRVRFPDSELLAKMQIDSYAGIRLTGSDGETLGIMAVMDTKPQNFSLYSQEILQYLGSRVSAEIERLQVEQDFKKNQQRYRDLVESSLGWIWEVDQQGTYTYSSPGVEKLLGYSVAEVIGKKPFDFLVEEERDRVKTFFDHSVKHSAAIHNFENINLGKDGRLVTLLTNGVPFFDHVGNFSGYRGTDIDITGSKNAQQLQAAQLRLIEYAANHTTTELLRKFLDEAEALTRSKIGFYHYVDEDQEILFLQTWSTRTVTDMCSTVPSARHYAVSQAGVWADCIRTRKALVHNDYASLENRRGLPEGHAPVIRELVVPVFRSGKIVAILGLGNKASDYTDADVSTVQRLADFSWETVARKKTAEELQRSRFALEKTQEMGHLGSWEIDIAANSLVWSVENYRIFGVPVGSAVDYETFLERVHPEDRSYVDREWQAALQGRPYDIEHRLLIEGEITWVREKADIRFDDEGRALNAIGFTQDITSTKKLLEDQGRQAQLAALGTVAAGVAHEINNPIQGIMNYATLIHNAPTKTDRVQDLAQRIIKESDRIAGITRDLLYYSNSNTIQKVDSDLPALVKSALLLIEAKVVCHGITLATDLPEALPAIVVNPQNIQQIIINLVDNACDALRLKEAPSASKRIRVSCALHDTGLGQFVGIEVEDNGMGMVERVKQRATEAFFSTKPSAEGTGLGLSIVNDIVRRHHGSMEFDSVEGEYTRVRILLPLQG